MKHYKNVITDIVHRTNSRTVTVTRIPADCIGNESLEVRYARSRVYEPSKETRGILFRALQNSGHASVIVFPDHTTIRYYGIQDGTYCIISD